MGIDRRKFLKGMGSLALFSIVPSKVLGGPNHIAPSDQLTKGIIGVGGIGRSSYHFTSNEQCRLVSVCDVDKNHLQKAVDLGKKKFNETLQTYHDFRDLIKDSNVDIVHIATPPHWHGLMAIEAAKAGKDIWCEKPMTRTIGEGKRLMEAVKQNNRIFRLNTWFRFKDNFYGLGTTVEPLKKLVDSGKYFTINRARQYGKTTTLRSLNRFLQAEYYVVLIDFQTFGNAKFKSENTFSLAFAHSFLRALKRNALSDKSTFREAIVRLEGYNK